MQLTLLRHGNTEMNKLGKINGQTMDDHLSFEGREQIECLTKTLARDFDVMISSDLARTRETAEIINSTLHLPEEFTSSLREIHLGRLTGLTWEEINIKCGEDTMKNYFAQDYDFRAFGGESVDEVKSRVFAYFDEIKEKHFNKKILVVTHGGVLRMLHYFLKGETLGVIDNATVHEFEV